MEKNSLNSGKTTDKHVWLYDSRENPFEEGTYPEWKQFDKENSTILEGQYSKNMTGTTSEEHRFIILNNKCYQANPNKCLM